MFDLNVIEADWYQTQSTLTDDDIYLAYQSADAEKIITGTMDVVFDSTREWYNKLDGRISIESIYYVCLEALMDAVYFCGQITTATFRDYLRNEINLAMNVFLADYDEVNDDNLSISTKPGTINHMLAKEPYYEDYIGNVSSNQFMSDYYTAVNQLPSYERDVIKLSYDSEGKLGLTATEISEYLGIDKDKVTFTKKRALNKLSNNHVLREYK